MVFLPCKLATTTAFLYSESLLALLSFVLINIGISTCTAVRNAHSTHRCLPRLLLFLHYKMIATTNRLLCLLLLSATVVSLVAGQTLNGYINPMWMTDRRRTDGRTIGGLRSDHYLSSSDLNYRSEIPRSPTMLVYLDDQGRYRPVYRQERLFRATDQNYYRISEPQQFLPMPSEQTPIISSY